MPIIYKKIWNYLKKFSSSFKFKKKEKISYDFSWESEVNEEREPQRDFSEFLGDETNKPTPKILYPLAGIFFLILLVRLFSLQITHGSENLDKAASNRVRYMNIEATRGLILDNTGKVLAQNKPSFSLVVYTVDLPRKEADRQKIYEEVAAASGISAAEIKAKIDKAGFRVFDPTIIKENLGRDEALIMQEKLVSLSGFKIENVAVRDYPYGSSLAHLLGYVTPMSEDDVLRHPAYLLTDKIGKAGIEKSYENDLKGKNGKELVEIDAAGNLKRYIAKEEPASGKTLELYLNADLQKAAEDSLKQSLSASGSKKGVVVAMDPKTGGILAMVSIPSYDDNIFNDKNAAKLYNELLQNPDNPLFNRAVSGVYPSGSTIKPVVAAAGLNEGTISSHTTIFDPGYLEVTSPYNPEAKYIYKDWKAHGYVDVYKALAWSCNVFFYSVGGGFGPIKGLGLGKLDEYYRKFGLGEETGIDLPLEGKGLVPDEAWKKKNQGEPWFLGDTYLLSIGQGNLEITPLQLLVATAAFANGGKLVEPRLVKETIGADNQKTVVSTKVKSENMVSADVLNVVRDGMRQGVTYGSSNKLNTLPVAVAGKTGTAETGKKDEKSHAWYTAFAPFNNPEIAIVVLVENGNEGTTAAVPVAKDVLSYYFSHK